MRNYFFTVALLMSSLGLLAQNPTVQAYRITNPPVIDGVLNDDVWQNVGTWFGPFTQQSPNEGQPETERTYIKILYDNYNIYVAFRAYDSEPERINRWLAPRDQVRGDWVAINFDTYADKRTAFAFGLTAGGTQFDCIINNDEHEDYTWNAVWQGKVSHDDKGWYAEFRIPLSQLRYSNTNAEQQWGFHAERFIDRKQEAVHLHLIPQQNAGYVFSFGTLTGISNLPRSRRMEFAPYTSVRYRDLENNPGNLENNWNFGLGLDGKIGITSDFTLDFTINPDFGQVEADPSTINLSAYEVFFEEKRPFFLEGKNIFGMRGENMFYSRRIGAPPAWRPSLEPGEYSSIPQNTRVLSAIKLSGKSKDGLSVGVINSVTAKETARILRENGEEDKITAQPMASYSVARVQQDINKGNTVIGGMLTSTNRFLNEDHLSHLIRNAYTGGADFEQYFKNREYFVRGGVQYSYVEGSQEAMIALQRSPVHYFQREGASHLSVDSSLTNLQGHSGTVSVGRGGENKIRTTHTYSWASEGFNLNDAGFLQSADYRRLRGNVTYRENSPTADFLRSYFVSTAYQTDWDYGDLNTFNQLRLEGETRFTNRWFVWASVNWNLRTVETSVLRGGPPVMLNRRSGTDMRFGSDPSKKLSFSYYHGTQLGDIVWGHFFWMDIRYRPIPNLGLTSRIDYSHRNYALQYVGQQSIETGERIYLMGRMQQDVAGLTLRADYSITPNLSLQFYGNPYISSGKYNEFKRMTNTMASDYEDRFVLLNPAFDTESNLYSVTNDEGRDFAFRNPDFSFREFRFNLVFRWEYRPNSKLYLVWSQDRSGREAVHTPSLGQNMNEMFRNHPHNVFMLKFTYWISA